MHSHAATAIDQFCFTPKTELEIQALQNISLLPDGVYSFTVKEAKNMISKTGNQMIQLRLAIKDHDGIEHNIFDFLVATDKMVYKIKHFCETVGLESEYTAGKFNPVSCVGRTGNAFVTIQKGKLREDGFSYYPDKNTVKDYIKPGVTPTNTATAGLNDDIAF